MPLFERDALEQETGLLSERWGQEGSEVKTAASISSSDFALLTVTSGKVFYLKHLSYYSNGAGDLNYIKDGSGGTTKMYLVTEAANQQIHLTFASPVKFETSVWCDLTGGVWSVNCTGWEEDE